MSYLAKKITLKKVSEMLSDRQLKRVVGGYGDGNGKEYCGNCTYVARSCEIVSVLCCAPSKESCEQFITENPDYAGFAECE